MVSFDAVSYASTEGLSGVSLVLNLTGIPPGSFQDNTLTVTLTIIDQGKTGKWCMINHIIDLSPRMYIPSS